MGTFEAMIIEAGFDSLAEFNRLVATTDISTPEKLRAFKRWQEDDGTKEGLQKLRIANNVNRDD